MARIDRVNANRALAKAIAYKDCGKDQEAERWAIALLRELQCHSAGNAGELLQQLITPRLVTAHGPIRAKHRQGSAWPILLTPLMEFNR